MGVGCLSIDLSNVEFVLDFDNTILNGLAFEDEAAASYFGYDSVQAFKSMVHDMGYFNWVDANIDKVKALFDSGYKSRLRQGFGWFLNVFSGLGAKFKIATSNRFDVVDLCLSSNYIGFDSSDFVSCNDGSGSSYDKRDGVLNYLLGVCEGKTLFYIGDMDSDMRLFGGDFSDRLLSSDAYLSEVSVGILTAYDFRDVRYPYISFNNGSRLFIDILGKSRMGVGDLPVTIHSMMSFGRHYSLYTSICDRLGIGY